MRKIMKDNRKFHSEIGMIKPQSSCSELITRLLE